MRQALIRTALAALGLALAAPTHALDFSKAPAQSFRAVILPPTADVSAGGDVSPYTVKSTAAPGGQTLRTIGDLVNGSLQKAGGTMTGATNLIPQTMQPQGFDTGGMLSIQNSSTTAQSVYGPQVPGFYYYNDTFRSTTLVPQGTLSTNTNAIGFYVRNINNQSLLPTTNTNNGNGVGIFGSVTCEVDHSTCWGENPTLADRSPSEVNTKFDGAGRLLIGAEYDISTQMTGSTAVGIALRGSSLRKPQFAGGFSCGHFGNDSTPGAGSPVIPWNVCFYTSDGDVEDFAVAGSLSTNAAAASQRLKLRNFDAAGVAHLTQIQGVLGGLSVSDDKAATTIGLIPGPVTSTIAAGGTLADVSLVLQAKGAGAIIANGPALINGGLVLSVANAGIDIGSKTAGNTPFIDLNSSGGSNDYDVRISAVNGLVGQVGKGGLIVTANAATFSHLAGTGSRAVCTNAGGQIYAAAGSTCP